MSANNERFFDKNHTDKNTAEI